MTQATTKTRKKVLAISSGGGHWVQLMRLTPAFLNADVVYACSDGAMHSDVPTARFHAYTDANKSQPLRLLRTTADIALILLRERPDVIVSTGAAGGSLAIGMGRLFGIRGLFVDSIANARRLSVSAKLCLHFANAVFTQWPDVAATCSARFRGSVL